MLIKFSPFSASVVCLFCNKTRNANNKTRRSSKARFLSNTLKKTPSSGKSLISTYSILGGCERKGGGGGRLFDPRRLLTFSAFRMGAYLFEVGANSRLGAYSNKYGKQPYEKLFKSAICCRQL